EFCIALALRNYEQFIMLGAEYLGLESLPEKLRPLISIYDRLRKGAPDTNGKVFCIGLSKTGTKSLARALEVLGYSTAHWINPFSCEILSQDYLILFDAFSDIPISFKFERCVAAFPSAKFIYTERPIDSWVNSFQHHFMSAHGCGTWSEINELVNRGDSPYGELFRLMHNELYLQHATAETAYRHHEARVLNFFQAERKQQLLRFNLWNGDGWEKLCEF